MYICKQKMTEKLCFSQILNKVNCKLDNGKKNLLLIYDLQSEDWIYIQIIW